MTSNTAIDRVFERVFKKLSGKPCWGVYIYGGTISFEFGKPRLEFHEPQRISRNVSHRVRDLFASRWLHIKGNGLC